MLILPYAESCWNLLSKKKLKSVLMLIAETSHSENAERRFLWAFMHYKYLISAHCSMKI